MRDNTDVRADMAHGRLDAAYDVIDRTAKEYTDQFDRDDDEHLAAALEEIGTVMGSLLGATHILEDADEDDIIVAFFQDSTPDAGDAFWSDEASALVGVRGTPSGHEVNKWAHHRYNDKKPRDRQALNDVKQQADAGEPMGVSEAKEYIKEHNEDVLSACGSIVVSDADERDLYVSTSSRIQSDDFETPHGWEAFDVRRLGVGFRAVE